MIIRGNTRKDYSKWQKKNSKTSSDFKKRFKDKQYSIEVKERRERNCSAQDKIGDDCVPIVLLQDCDCLPNHSVACSGLAMSVINSFIWMHTRDQRLNSDAPTSGSCHSILFFPYQMINWYRTPSGTRSRHSLSMYTPLQTFQLYRSISWTSFSSSLYSGRQPRQRITQCAFLLAAHWSCFRTKGGDSYKKNYLGFQADAS